MKTLLHLIFMTALLSLGQAFAKTANNTESIFPMTQGLHTWNLPLGKVTGIVSTYQDTVTFRRNYNFFIQPAKSADWVQVPVTTNPDNVDFSFNSSGQGDDLLIDGLIIEKNKNLYFVKAATVKGDINVTWFQFLEADDQHSDDAPYAFKSVFTRNYAKKLKLSIEQVLKKEFKLEPK